MSRGYRVQVPLQVARGTVTGSDELCIGLDVLPILPEGEMVDLVRQTLKEKGWKNGPEGTLEKPLGDGAVAVLDADGKTVTVRMSTQAEVSGAGVTDQEAKAALERQKDAATKEVRAKATQQLARLEGDVRTELDEAVQRVYVEALKKKAAQMGQIESQVESRGADGSLEITIKVKA